MGSASKSLTPGTWDLGPDDTASFNFVGPIVSGTVTQDPEDAPIDWNDVWVDLDSYSTQVSSDGNYFAYPGYGDFVVSARSEGYLVNPGGREVETTTGTTAGIDFTLNKAHCRVSGTLINVTTPLSLSNYSVVAHTSTGSDGYTVQMMVDSLTGSYTLWLCDGDWSIQPPFIDGYFALGDISLIIDEIPDTVQTVDFNYSTESLGSCCGQYTSGFTGNTNYDTEGLRDLADIVKLIDRVYLTKLPLDCEGTGNVNGDSEAMLDLADITRLIDHVYLTKAETEPCASGWVTVFEDNFDGSDLDTINWSQVDESPGTYSLTGDGELQVDGPDGAFFVYNTPITSNYVRVTTKFRTTQNDPIEDDVELIILLNADYSGNFYELSMMSDPFENTRDYELILAKWSSGVRTILTSESLSGMRPQILPDNDYTLVGANYDGTLTLLVKDTTGLVLKSIAYDDSSYSDGLIGFGGDVNIDTSPPQEIYFDYVRVEIYP